MVAINVWWLLLLVVIIVLVILALRAMFQK